MASEVDTKILQKMKLIAQYEAQIDRARGSASGAAAKKRKYERRRSQVNAVKRNLQNKFDSVVGSISRHQAALVSAAGDGVRGVAAQGLLVGKVQSDAERPVENDAYGAQMLMLLDNEMSQCLSKISEADREASSAQGAINQASSQRATLVSQVKTLLKDPEATVHVSFKRGY